MKITEVEVLEDDNGRLFLVPEKLHWEFSEALESFEDGEDQYHFWDTFGKYHVGECADSIHLVHKLYVESKGIYE